MFKYSYYNLVNENNNTYTIFNTYSGAILKLDRNEYNDYKTILTDNTNKEMFDILLQNGFIVESDKEEEKIIELSRIKNSLQTNNLFFRILPTTNCNARCFYCYENGVEHYNMKEEDIENVVNFINSCIKQDTKMVSIQWYGGEPLLKYKLIKKLTDKLINLFSNKNIKYSFTMISNGLLLDKITPLRIFKELNLKNIQISLDGNKEEYLKRKSFVGGHDYAFENIIANINSMAQIGIKVDVRLNCDGTNFASMKELIDILGEQFIKKENINVYPYPIYGTYVNGNKIKENDFTKEMLLDIIDKLIKNDLYKIPSFKAKTSSCGATNFNSFVILPNGKLLKCMMKDDDFVGDIFKGIDYNNNYFKWCSFSLPDECKKCVYLPLCQGGCKAGHLNLAEIKCFVYKNLIFDMLTRVPSR